MSFGVWVFGFGASSCAFGALSVGFGAREIFLPTASAACLSFTWPQKQIFSKNCHAVSCEEQQLLFASVRCEKHMKHLCCLLVILIGRKSKFYQKLLFSELSETPLADNCNWPRNQFYLKRLFSVVRNKNCCLIIILLGRESNFFKTQYATNWKRPRKPVLYKKYFPPTLINSSGAGMFIGGAGIGGGGGRTSFIIRGKDYN